MCANGDRLVPMFYTCRLWKEKTWVAPKQSLTISIAMLTFSGATRRSRLDMCRTAGMRLPLQPSPVEVLARREPQWDQSVFFWMNCNTQANYQVVLSAFDKVGPAARHCVLYTSCIRRTMRRSLWVWDMCQSKTRFNALKKVPSQWRAVELIYNRRFFSRPL